MLWNIYTDLKDAGYRPVGTAALERLVARSGIGPDWTVVFYGYTPAVGLWLMKLYGHLDLPSRAVRGAGFQLAEQVRLCLPVRWGGIRALTALRVRLQLATSCPALGRGRACSSRKPMSPCPFRRKCSQDSDTCCPFLAAQSKQGNCLLTPLDAPERSLAFPERRSQSTSPVNLDPVASRSTPCSPVRWRPT